LLDKLVFGVGVGHGELALDLCAIEAYIWRMATTLKEPKSQRFVARVTAADKQLFQKAAAIEGRSLAKFITMHTREVARQIVAKSDQIQLNAAQSRRFVEALLAPPRPPTPAMRESILAYRRSVKSDLD
jgi:uncharacterized protein (DUF1778 family)